MHRVALLALDPSQLWVFRGLVFDYMQIKQISQRFPCWIQFVAISEHLLFQVGCGD